MRDVRSPTLKGSHSLEPPDASPPWHQPDSTLSGSDLVGGGAFSGGVAPGYSLDPLRGSGVDSAEDVLGGKKRLKRLPVRPA
jgi:hypothetical protein